MDYKFKHGDKVRVVRLDNQCTARNSFRIKVGDVFTIEGPFDRSFGSNKMIYSVQEEETLVFWEDELELVDRVQDNKEAANVEMVHLDFMIPKNNKKEAIRIANSAKYKIYSALAKKRQASELLDGIRVGRLSYNEYCTIRDALEEMACVLEIYDDCTDGYEKGEGKIKNPIPRHGAATHKNMRKRR